MHCSKLLIAAGSTLYLPNNAYLKLLPFMYIYLQVSSTLSAVTLAIVNYFYLFARSLIYWITFVLIVPFHCIVLLCNVHIAFTGI